MSWSETRQTLLDVALARLGLVRQKHYDELSGRYNRLTHHYICFKDITKRSVIADADKYVVIERTELEQLRRGGGL